MNNRYDIPLKDLFSDIPPKLLKLLCVFEEAKVLDSQLPEISYRQADMILELPDDTLLHIEIQSYNDKSMALRMLGYYYHIYSKYKKDITQVVLYVGKEDMKMESSLELKNLNLKYNLINIADVDSSYFLDSSSIDDNVIAILCKTDNNRRLVNAVLDKLKKLEEKTAKNNIKKLIEISNLRGFDIIIKKEVSTMPIRIDPKDIVFYKDGHKDGKEEGREEGRKETKIEDILDLHKNLKLPAKTIAQGLNLDVEYVEKILRDKDLIK